jgi:hypothetical protein
MSINISLKDIRSGQNSYAEDPVKKLSAKFWAIDSRCFRFLSGVLRGSIAARKLRPVLIQLIAKVIVKEPSGKHDSSN